MHVTCPYSYFNIHDYNNSSDQLPDPKQSLPQIEKCIESDHCSIDNDIDHVDKEQQSASESAQRVYDMIMSVIRL